MYMHIIFFYFFILQVGAFFYLGALGICINCIYCSADPENNTMQRVVACRSYLLTMFYLWIFFFCHPVYWDASDLYRVTLS